MFQSTTYPVKNVKNFTASIRVSLLLKYCLTMLNARFWENEGNASICLCKALRSYAQSVWTILCQVLCMLFYISLSPQRSLGCESHRLEVPGPGGVRCVRTPGGKRGISSFSTLYSLETTWLLLKMEKIARFLSRFCLRHPPSLLTPFLCLSFLQWHHWPI